MKIGISYFYQIRFFKPWMIPVSTAAWDPKWFHDFKDNNYVFKDKNGVYNGIRYEPLHPGETCDGLCRGPKACLKKYGYFNPETCQFLKEYRKQLDQLDFDKMMDWLDRLAKRAEELNDLNHEPMIVLIVYETPEKVCSERQTLIDYFGEHGIEVSELKYPINDNY